MKTYIYKVTDGSQARGYNRTITVYRMIRNKPVFVACNDEINTASTYGDYAEAVQLTGEKNNHYKFDNDNIQLFEV